jgi:hypothetical protein
MRDAYGILLLLLLLLLLLPLPPPPLHYHHHHHLLLLLLLLLLLSLQSVINLGLCFTVPYLYRQSVGLLGWGISPSQGRYQYSTT